MSNNEELKERALTLMFSLQIVFSLLKLLATAPGGVPPTRVTFDVRIRNTLKSIDKYEDR